MARKLNPKVHIVVRTRFLGEVDALRRLGADDVIPEDFETSIEIFSRVLGHYLVPRQTIERFVNSIRHEYYNMARQLRMTGMDLPSLADEVLTGLEVVACKVEPGCALDGKRLMDTSLRKKYGVTVVGIRHAGQIIPVARRGRLPPRRRYGIPLRLPRLPHDRHALLPHQSRAGKSRRFVGTAFLRNNSKNPNTLQQKIRHPRER